MYQVAENTFATEYLSIRKYLRPIPMHNKVFIYIRVSLQTLENLFSENRRKSMNENVTKLLVSCLCEMRNIPIPVLERLYL